MESPTLVMIQAIDRRGEEGLARATLFAQLTDEVLVAPRVERRMDHVDGSGQKLFGRVQVLPVEIDHNQLRVG